jgi:sec-independent protein translocase protein TatB
VFGLSFGELIVVCVVALVAVGPQKLPGMLRTLGQWVRKLRTLTTEVRHQTGIDQLLREEGLHGGLNELRGILRGNQYTPPPRTAPRTPAEDPYANIDADATREYPPEGADAYGALPDDLIDEAPAADVAQANAEPAKG